MKAPPADTDVMIECALCADVLHYGDARAAPMYPVMGGGDGPGALRATAVVECRCGRTAVYIQQRGEMRLAIPRRGETLAGSSGTDASVIL
jgi:hypothetical protein